MSIRVQTPSALFLPIYIFLFATLSANLEAIDLRVKGPPSIVIPVKSLRTMGQNSQLQTSIPLGLWCQAVNGRTLDVIPAQEITFRHHGVVWPTQLDKNGENGTFNKETVTLGDAGIWTCDVRSRSHGNATGDISVFLRPVIVSNSSLRIDDHDPSKNHFAASGVTIIHGEDTRLECPVFGYPRPEIKWKSKGQSVVAGQNPRLSVKDGVLLIKNVTEADEGTYICTATNSFKHKGQIQAGEVIVERRLRVKSELAWVTPLCVIMVVVILLVITIVSCECRKKKNEQKLLVETNAEEE